MGVGGGGGGGSGGSGNDRVVGDTGAVEVERWWG